MFCECVVQSGKNKGSLCGRKLKEGFLVCGMHKKTCVYGSGAAKSPSPRVRNVSPPIKPKGVRPPTRSPPKKASAKSPLVSVQHSKVERYIKKVIESLSEQEAFSITFGDIKKLVQEKFGDKVQYKRDYTKDFVMGEIRERVLRDVIAYLKTVVFTYSVESLTVGKVKSMVVKKFGNVVNYADYKEDLVKLVNKKRSILDSDDCRRCKASLKM